jgi:hypothetical protein
LGTFQHVFDARYGIQLRVGIDLGNAAPHSSAAHVELGGRYWFGRDFTSTRGFVGVGLGYGSYDTAVDVTVRDCSEATGADGTEQCLASSTGEGALDRRVTAVRRFGNGFGKIAGGVLVLLGRHQGLLLQTSLIGTYPAQGFVIEPSVGYSHGW